MERDPLVLAYMAGVIDSDGFISVTQSCRKGRLYFGAVIGVSGTRREPHDLAASLWGGNVRRYDPPNPRHRGQFQWSRQGEAAAAAIEEVYPYLRIKQDQAVLAIECQDIVREARSDDPFPWFGPDYDPTPYLTELRRDVIGVLNQGRRMPLPMGALNG